MKQYIQTPIDDLPEESAWYPILDNQGDLIGIADFSFGIWCFDNADEQREAAYYIKPVTP